MKKFCIAFYVLLIFYLSRGVWGQYASTMKKFCIFFFVFFSFCVCVVYQAFTAFHAIARTPLRIVLLMRRRVVAAFLSPRRTSLTRSIIW